MDGGHYITIITMNYNIITAVMLFLELLCGRYPVISGRVLYTGCFIINIKHCCFTFIQDVRHCDVIYMTQRSNACTLFIECIAPLVH